MNPPSSEAVQWLIAFGVGGLLIELVRSLFTRKKMSADATKVMVDTATTLLSPLRDRVVELEKSLTTTRSELTTTHADLRVTITKCDETDRELRRTQDELHQTTAQLNRAHKLLREATTEIGRLRMDLARASNPQLPNPGQPIPIEPYTD